jgi:helicase
MRRLNPFLRILGLSATLGNRQELAEWLGGVEYVSKWRPVPLEWRFVKLQKATEKPELLFSEVSENVRCGGKKFGICAKQTPGRRNEFVFKLARNSFVSSSRWTGARRAATNRAEVLSGEIDVLVATATLEMGLNLPVRQVVPYDVQMLTERISSL